HRACCCPSCFCQTSPGNPQPPASLQPSARRSHREKRGETANDGKAHHLQGPVGLSPRRTESSFEVTLIFPLVFLASYFRNALVRRKITIGRLCFSRRARIRFGTQSPVFARLRRGRQSSPRAQRERRKESV